MDPIYLSLATRSLCISTCGSIFQTFQYLSGYRSRLSLLEVCYNMLDGISYIAHSVAFSVDSKVCFPWLHLFFWLSRSQHFLRPSTKMTPTEMFQISYVAIFITVLRLLLSVKIIHQSFHLFQAFSKSPICLHFHLYVNFPNFSQFHGLQICGRHCFWLVFLYWWQS